MMGLCHYFVTKMSFTFCTVWLMIVNDTVGMELKPQTTQNQKWDQKTNKTETHPCAIRLCLGHVTLYSQ